MKRVFKNLAVSATTAAILAVPITTTTSGSGSGQETKTLSGFYYSNLDDNRYDYWDDH
ncbi:hypothetical protein [Candidatus Arthromitus sp. SFB-turkey]|uniref:hypothetical protein n=1 Tax=Candidatus Arthromitus sp. SFB-turkey TaxID=1840217 RepID=UPI000AAACC40|nr:hypothetical protein [Candidatus Arthromitus sp. SFB-turkey]